MTYGTSATDTGSGVGAPVCAPASGSSFPIGRTVVTCNVSDVAGNAAAPKSFAVIVTRPCLTAWHAGVLAVARGRFRLRRPGRHADRPGDRRRRRHARPRGSDDHRPRQGERCGCRPHLRLDDHGAAHDHRRDRPRRRRRRCGHRAVRAEHDHGARRDHREHRRRGVQRRPRRRSAPHHRQTGALPPPDTGPVHATGTTSRGPSRSRVERGLRGDRRRRAPARGGDPCGSGQRGAVDRALEDLPRRALRAGRPRRRCGAGTCRPRRAPSSMPSARRSSRRRPARRTTSAATSSPSVSCGTPTTAASSTSGCA